MIKNDDEMFSILKVYGKKRKKILYFLQGLIYAWCVAHKDCSESQQWFSMRDLAGDTSGIDWDKTPLKALKDAYKDENGNISDESDKQLKEESEWLLLDAIRIDEKTFDTQKNQDKNIREYRLET